MGNLGKLNSKGFSLVEILIAAGLMGILTVGTSILITSQMASVSYLEDRLAKVDLKQVILDSIGNDRACKNSFATANLASTQVYKSVKDSSGNLVLQEGDKFGNLIVNRFEISTLERPVPSALNKAKLEIILDRKRSSTHVLAPILVNFNVMLDASYEVTSCTFDPVEPLDPDEYNFKSFYVVKVANVPEGKDICCNEGDILISGHWAQYTGEKSVWFVRKQGNRCMEPWEGESPSQDGNVEMFCGKTFK